jgi:hypothetical protein
MSHGGKAASLLRRRCRRRRLLLAPFPSPPVLLLLPLFSSSAAQAKLHLESDIVDASRFGAVDPHGLQKLPVTLIVEEAGQDVLAVVLDTTISRTSAASAASPASAASSPSFSS